MITIRLDEGEVTARLADASRRLTDMSDLMADIADGLSLSTRKRFASGTDPEGNAWVPRSQATLDRYASMKPPRRPGPHPLTVSTGLMRSIHPFSGPDHAGVGSSQIYAAAMQFGAAQGQFGAAIGKDKRGRDYFHPIPWGNIPARPFLGLSAQDRTEVIATTAEHLSGVADPG